MDTHWVMYDIPKENIMFCDVGDVPTQEELRANIIKMTYAQAEQIRRAKGLPMPSPPVDVEVVGYP